MNTGLTINATANTIEMTKEFAKKAKYYGTEEYTQLQKARKDYPTYSVVTRKSVSKESYKGLKRVRKRVCLQHCRSCQRYSL